MKSAYAAAMVLWAACAWAQGPGPSPQLREFLQLTDAQFDAILAANRLYDEWTSEKRGRLIQVQREIAQSTAASPLDPMALGTRYAEIEATCREVRDRAADLEKANVSLLSDEQKARLKLLEDALKLWPVIAQAQASRLLGAPAAALPGQSIMGMITTADRFSRTDGARLGTIGPALPGCSSPVVYINGRNVVGMTHAGLR